MTSLGVAVMVTRPGCAELLLPVIMSMTPVIARPSQSRPLSRRRQIALRSRVEHSGRRRRITSPPSSKPADRVPSFRNDLHAQRATTRPRVQQSLDPNVSSPSRVVHSAHFFDHRPLGPARPVFRQTVRRSLADFRSAGSPVPPPPLKSGARRRRE